MDSRPERTVRKAPTIENSKCSDWLAINSSFELETKDSTNYRVSQALASDNSTNSPISGHRAIEIAKEFSCVLLRHKDTEQHITTEQAQLNPLSVQLEVPPQWHVIDMPRAEEALNILSPSSTLESLSTEAAKSTNPREWFQTNFVIPASAQGYLITSRTITGILTAFASIHPKIAENLAVADARHARRTLLNAIEDWDSIKPSQRVALWCATLPKHQLTIVETLVRTDPESNIPTPLYARCAKRGELAALSKILSPEVLKSHWYPLLCRGLSSPTDMTDLVAYTETYSQCLRFEGGGTVGVTRSGKKWLFVGEQPTPLRGSVIF